MVNQYQQNEPTTCHLKLFFFSIKNYHEKELMINLFL